MFPINGVVPQQNKPFASANTYPWRTQFTGGGDVFQRQKPTSALKRFLSWLRGTPVPPQQKSSSSSGIWLPLLLGLGVIGAIALRPQKMLKHAFHSEPATRPTSTPSSSASSSTVTTRTTTSTAIVGKIRGVSPPTAQLSKHSNPERELMKKTTSVRPLMQ
jgi:hypothetical protein